MVEPLPGRLCSSDSRLTFLNDTEGGLSSPPSEGAYYYGGTGNPDTSKKNLPEDQDDDMTIELIKRELD